MKKKNLPKLPDSPGVYLLRKKGRFYISEKLHLSKICKKLFRNDLNTRGPIICDMVTKSDELDF